ncbi:hypothetical protein HanIR_Chr04g0184601 [Helianthus annuus]|nr:hypothetical protein HanIR_Chr04g0184601 [Helianthus annuus]
MILYVQFAMAMDMLFGDVLFLYTKNRYTMLMKHSLICWWFYLKTTGKSVSIFFINISFPITNLGKDSKFDNFFKR